MNQVTDCDFTVDDINSCPRCQTANLEPELTSPDNLTAVTKYRCPHCGYVLDTQKNWSVAVSE